MEHPVEKRIRHLEGCMRGIEKRVLSYRFVPRELVEEMADIEMKMRYLRASISPTIEAANLGFMPKINGF